MRYLHLLPRFLAVAEAGSIAKAARRLNITSPSLTKSIHALEADLETQLFERHAKGMSLTPFGEKLLAHARVINQEIQFAEAEMQAFRTGSRGVLRIGAIPVWGYYLLPSAIARLHDAFPSIQVNLSVGTNASLVPRITNGEIDVFAGGRLEETGDLPPYLDLIKGPDIEVFLVAREGHPVHQAGEPVNPADLSKYPWAMFGGSSSDLDFDFIEQRVVETMSAMPQISLVSQSLMAVAEAVRSGDYITWMADPVLRSFQSNGIRKINLADSFYSFSSCLVFRRSLAEISFFKLLARHVIPG